VRLDESFTESDKTSHQVATFEDQDQGVMPHATVSAVRLTEDIAKGVKDIAKAAVNEAVAWVEQKADKLSNEHEDGVGPYASPGLCAPSDLDAIATGVLPAMPSHETREKGEARKLEHENATTDTNKDDPGLKKPTEEQRK
jgi:hypothetical protein